ncbi:MAG: transcription antitermination factor NusB [Firmicutes bacterium]|nr:transcription antitermination factor NusB [Bacillota bacterium]
MTRKDARELMMQVFFQMEACNDFDVNNRETYLSQDVVRSQRDYCNELFSLLCNKKDEIDEMLETYSKGWKLSRMPKTDVAVLRVSVCEMVYLNLPAAVSINEAVDLAKLYGTDDSAKYVNAILGKVAANCTKKNEEA